MSGVGISSSASLKNFTTKATPLEELLDDELLLEDELLLDDELLLEDELLELDVLEMASPLLLEVLLVLAASLPLDELLLEVELLLDEALLELLVDEVLELLELVVELELLELLELLDELEAEVLALPDFDLPPQAQSVASKITKKRRIMLV